MATDYEVTHLGKYNPDKRKPSAQEEEQESKPDGWISVKDRLPKDSKEVLLYQKTPKERIFIDRLIFHHSDGMKWERHSRYDITHWRPLPKQPVVLEPLNPGDLIKIYGKKKR